MSDKKPSLSLPIVSARGFLRRLYNLSVDLMHKIEMQVCQLLSSALFKRASRRSHPRAQTHVHLVALGPWTSFLSHTAVGSER